ncbi:MAG: hypothetical protein KTR31_16820 [Myxococcales bacterium]|nr:hypothetical protein [Myxococcales bacterium]
MSRLAVGLLTVVLLFLGPFAPLIYMRPKYATWIALDVGMALGVLFALLWVSGGWSRPSEGRFGTWRSWALGAVWGGLATFGWLMSGSRIATNEPLPLYDLSLLLRHVWILGMDLYGAWSTVAAVAAAFVPLLLAVAGAWLFGSLEREARQLGKVRSGQALAGVLAFTALAAWLPVSEWLVPSLTRNLRESAELYGQVRSDIDGSLAAELATLEITRRPDVHIYIVESYGDIVRRGRLARHWEPMVDRLDSELTEAGWATASGMSHAPVHGGRSWMADAAVLFGISVTRQVTYEHLISLVDELPHLPGFMAEQGYETVLVRPKDRARPGVELVNYFDFSTTVFFDDLQYRGPVVGWGHIPDQYTVDYVHEHVLDGMQAPSFAFFHLATAHIPWLDAPPILEPYTLWQQQEGRTEPIYKERSRYSEFRMRMSRFKRRNEGKHKPTATADPESYLDNVLYDLEVLSRQLASGPQREQLVVMMGDHQPPLIANGRRPDVPIHLLASSPELLEPFLQAGFERGLRPANLGPAPIRHRDLFPLLARTLTIK